MIFEGIRRLFASQDKSEMTYIQQTGQSSPIININKKELLKMDKDNKVEVTMQWKDGQGQVRFSLTATYDLLDYAGVVKIENTLCGAMMDLGEASAQEQPAV